MTDLGPDPTWPEEDAARYRAAGYWAGETFGDMLRRGAVGHPDREAVVGLDARWTYGDLDERASNLAGGFAALGLVRGERVVVQLPNEPVFIEVLFGLFRLGAIPILALPAHRSSELVHFATHAEAAAVVTVGTRGRFDHAALACAVRDACPSVRHVVVDDVAPPEGTTPLGHLRSSARPAPHASAGPASSDLALLQLSGGTTGLSKLIPRTHDDYLYSVRRSAAICGQGAATRYLAVLPAGHNFPLSSAGILGTLASGGTVVMCPSPDPATALDLIARERITITGVVPPLARAWVEAVAAGAPAPTTLKTLQVGGAKLDVSLAQRIEPVLGARLQQVFGMAEGLVNYTRAGDPLELVLTTQGRPMSPADEVRVVDEDDVDVAPGAVGALLTRGPYTIRGYWRAPKQNAESFTADGFYRTGDLVRQLPSGHLVVEGRAKEQINRGGEKVAPAEVEGHLLAHPAVIDACVVGLADDALGERTCAVVVARAPAPTPAALRRFVRDSGIAAFKVPDRITFVDAFPTTGVGKTSRRELRLIVAASLEGRPAHDRAAAHDPAAARGA